MPPFPDARFGTGIVSVMDINTMEFLTCIRLL
jgi:hypothetical protein